MDKGRGRTRNIDIIVLGSRYCIRSFIHTILFLNVHNIEGLVFLFYKETKAHRG